MRSAAWRGACELRRRPTRQWAPATAAGRCPAPGAATRPTLPATRRRKSAALRQPPAAPQRRATAPAIAEHTTRRPQTSAVSPGELVPIPLCSHALTDCGQSRWRAPRRRHARPTRPAQRAPCICLRASPSDIVLFARFCVVSAWYCCLASCCAHTPAIPDLLLSPSTGRGDKLTDACLPDNAGPESPRRRCRLTRHALARLGCPWVRVPCEGGARPRTAPDDLTGPTRCEGGVRSAFPA